MNEELKEAILVLLRLANDLNDEGELTDEQVDARRIVSGYVEHGPMPDWQEEG